MTKRVMTLVKVMWPQSEFPYTALSASAHGELPSLLRNLEDAPDAAGSAVAPGLRNIWLWYDTYLAAGALIFTAVRAARFLGLDAHATLETERDRLGVRLNALLPT